MIKEVCNLVKKLPSRETKLKEICKTIKNKYKKSARFTLHDGLFTERRVHLFSTTMNIEWNCENVRQVTSKIPK